MWVLQMAVSLAQEPSDQGTSCVGGGGFGPNRQNFKYESYFSQVGLS